MPQRPSIQQPSGYVTLNAVAFADTQGNATSVAVASPLPVASVTPRDGAALSTPLTGSVSDVIPTCAVSDSEGIPKAAKI